MGSRIGWFALGGLLAVGLLASLYLLPPVRDRLEWRFDAAGGIVRGWLHPGDTLPTPIGYAAARATLTPAPTHIPPPTPLRTATPPLTPTPLPSAVALAAPEWEKQDWNNCGPATLALGLRFYGWTGNQFDISDLLKPDRGDKNVNVEELVYYVRTHAGWLAADFRVGGDLALLRRLIAAGFPVIVEKGYTIVEGGGGWAGHYLLLTGYDDASQVFIVQDTNVGPDRQVPYDVLDEGWRAFNRVYLLIYPPDDRPAIEALLGPDADPDSNREHALETAQAEVEQNADDPYSWFNLGSNLLYFERYSEAAEAYDQALSIGLPWRFTRYQFGPYIAYFNTARYDDLIALADATLYRTSKAEESLLWRGWARYRLGDLNAAIEDFRSALDINPNYFDAQYALDFVGGTP